ncbi:GNAT family N-acetyltransferase [Serratia rubidaea]|uniref:GNAT family N-acetyltransferase n=1 Tax=Serratia rubidaea TaxID=61652 RepID=UPI003A4C67A2
MVRNNQFGQCIGDALPEWQPAGEPGLQTLCGRFCRLEPLDIQRDAAALFHAYQLAEDGRDWTYLSHEYPQTLDEFTHYLQSQGQAGGRKTMTVFDQRSGRAIGNCAFLRIDQANGSVELGMINWSPLMQRHVSGSEAIFLMLRHVFDDLGYRRCEWKCDQLNAPSRAAALRFGFSFEGTFRQAVVVKGRTRDTDWLSMLDSEWPQRRAAFSRWLAADNMDDDGRQTQRLQAFAAWHAGAPRAVTPL